MCSNSVVIMKSGILSYIFHYNYDFKEQNVSLQQFWRLSACVCHTTHVRIVVKQPGIIAVMIYNNMDYLIFKNQKFQLNKFNTW